jgi:hypothetical protein
VCAGRLGGSVNLTMPVATWLGGSEAPGEAAGFGPVPATDARDLAALLASRPGTRWCLTLTGDHGHAIGHGCATTTSGGGGKGTGPPGALTVTITPLATSSCGHQRQTPSYRPTSGLRHTLQVRQRTCSFPSCRRAAASCDLDHTVPFAHGGRTCECAMAPLCRRHHKAKQAHGWRLEQPQPGILLWHTPHGRTYRAEPDPYLE